MGRRIRYRPNALEEQFVVAGRPRDNTFLTPQTIVTIAVVWVVVLVVIVAGGYFLMQNRKFQNEFAPMVDVCQGKRINEASTYSPTPGKHPAVSATNSSSGWQLDSYFIPGEVLAQSLAETELVLCVEKAETIFIERCPYGETSYTHALERYYRKQDARLVEAKTGRVVSVQTFTGSSPRYCHEKERFSEDDKIETLVGSEVSPKEIRGWVSSHLIIQP
ncbi:MAG TPA: hypothetical protein VEC93_11175 [Anaerolineae bacterium]|nr:hypothetical protein [Anaerolineae bacterium]